MATNFVFFSGAWAGTRIGPGQAVFSIIMSAHEPFAPLYSFGPAAAPTSRAGFGDSHGNAQRLFGRAAR